MFYGKKQVGWNSTILLRLGGILWCMKDGGYFTASFFIDETVGNIDASYLHAMSRTSRVFL
jgi:hypothetical protein